MPSGMSEILSELQDDFIAESDEHLSGIRRDLLTLESMVDSPDISPSLLDDLFRHFHSFKGLSAMVGLRDAERLSHHMESYLRALRGKQVSLSAAGLDALIAGTSQVEQIITASSHGEPAPDIENSLILLEHLVPEDKPAAPSARLPEGTVPGLSAEEVARLTAALQRGEHAWRVTFMPSAELASRGVNVTAIRARLQSSGELIHAAPRVTGDAGIAFEFIVATRAPEPDALWHGDGLEYAPLAAATSEPVQPGSTPGRDASAGADAGPTEDSAPPAVPASAPSLSRGPAHSVRVDLSRLDDLMRMVGDLVISRARLSDAVDRLERKLAAPQWRPLQEINTAFEHQLRDLREGVMRVRMVPIGEVFERMHFVVRDLAREHGKQVHLEISGRETEIDKLVVERMMDPMMHLVRNAVSHGLETPAERAASGKPPEGQLTLAAAAAGDSVRIEIRDDGRGIDLDKVTRRARELKLIGPNDWPDMLSLVDLISLPGFSTSDSVDRASGRGVGMSIVKNTVQELGGVLSVDTTPGHGTCFVLELPLTLSIVDALIVRVGESSFAVPLPAVREVMQVPSSDVRQFENNEVISYRGSALPMVRLARLFGLPDPPRPSLHALVIGSGSTAVGIAVDRIVNQREIVVHALADPLVHVPGISGATELGDGRVVLIVDGAGLARLAQKPERRPRNSG